MSDPIAYLITFRTYGTWLHGDDRGSTDRQHNAYKGAMLRPNAPLLSSMVAHLKSEPVVLTDVQRRMIESTIGEVCVRRDWTLHALAVRSNHAHLLVSADLEPERVMNALKSWCTRRLREARLIAQDNPVWSRHGSTRYIWNERSFKEAGRYVVEGQGHA